MDQTLTEVNDSKVCPRCGESSPAAASMCWSCYGHFSPKTLKKHIRERIQKVLANKYAELKTFQELAFACGTFFLIVSGWGSRDGVTLFWFGAFLWAWLSSTS